MTDCINPEIRDALPDLLGRRLSELDTATMTAHVESCAACRAEIELLHEVRRSAPLAPTIDVARVVAALPAYDGVTIAAPGRDDRLTPSASSRSLVWKVAAAAVLVTLAGFGITGVSRDGVSRNPWGATAEANTQTSPVATSASLESAAVAGKATTTKESGAAAEAASRGGASIGLSLVAGVQDLTDSQIETLLAELDALETLPSAEPEPFTISVEEMEGGL